MARRKKAASGGPGSGDWLNTYADMVTLLLTFFILLFSMSRMDAAKFNMIVEAFRSEGESDEQIIIGGELAADDVPSGQPAALDVPEDINMDEIFTMLAEMIAEQNMEDEVTMSQGPGYVFVRFPDDMFFEPNSSTLRAESLTLLDFVGTGLRSVQEETTSISIVGHTAAIPDNPDYAVSDRLLSSARADNVLIYFEDVVGVDPQKLFSTGYGKWKPVLRADGTYEDNLTEESRAKNRRVEILIQNEGASLSEQLDNVYERLIEQE